MSRLRIINMKKYKLEDNEMLIKVDKSSILGNPIAGKVSNEIERKVACDYYEIYFRQQINENEEFKNEVKFIEDCLKQNKNVALGCWCYPKRCHAETIMKYINEKKADSNDNV